MLSCRVPSPDRIGTTSARESAGFDDDSAPSNHVNRASGEERVRTVELGSGTTGGLGGEGQEPSASKLCATLFTSARSSMASAHSSAVCATQRGAEGHREGSQSWPAPRRLGASLRRWPTRRCTTAVYGYTSALGEPAAAQNRVVPTGTYPLVDIPSSGRPLVGGAS
jgi:hypothetical protein